MKPHVLLALAGAVALGMLAAPAADAARPDLRVAALTPPSGPIAPGTSVQAQIKVANRGARAAGRSSTQLLLSRDARAGNGDIRVARASTGRIRPSRRTRLSAAFAPPAGAAGAYRLIACADSRKRVKESRGRNNCRAARAVLTVRAPATTPTTQPAPTTEAASTVPPAPAPCAPGQPDLPDLAFVDSDCDGDRRDRERRDLRLAARAGRVRRHAHPAEA